VLNFGHGAFVSVGAFAATLVLLPMRGWLEADSLAPTSACWGWRSRSRWWSRP
jgi:branched-chain amino acid transport system permease protein